jgi:hypothetical protein
MVSLVGIGGKDLRRDMPAALFQRRERSLHQIVQIGKSYQT